MTEDSALSLTLDLITKWEGFRSAPYGDQAGVWTIGYGSTYLLDGSHVTAETPPVTQTEAHALLSIVAAKNLAAVREMVHVPITDNQAAALTSFAYNEGTARLRNSSIMSSLNRGQTQEAADWFRAFVYAGGHLNHGLMNRREDERALFLRADQVAIPAIESPSTEDLNAASLARAKQGA